MLLSALCPCLALHQAQQFCRAPSDACLMPWAHGDAQRRRMGQLHRHIHLSWGQRMPCGGPGVVGLAAWHLPARALTSLQEPTRRGPVSDLRKDFLRACPTYAHARAVAREGFGQQATTHRGLATARGSEVLGGWASQQRVLPRQRRRELLHSLLVCLTSGAGDDEAPSRGKSVDVTEGTRQPGSALPLLQ